MGMITPLTQLLQGLCSDGLWRYAVFWSFKSEGNGILSWGDGYIEKTIQDSQIRDICSAGPIVCRNQKISPSSCNEGNPLCLIEAALLRMASNSYLPGEEIVGKVALTGKYSWILANELCSSSVHKYHEDWQLQFKAGIKTVLLAPVIPHGVLQLGSLDMVSESSALVTLIQDLFHELYNSSVSHVSLATGPSHSDDTLRQPIATLSVDSQDLIAVVDNYAQLLTDIDDHLSLPLPSTMPEFPILEDVSTDAYRSGWPNGPWAADGFWGYEDFLTDVGHAHEERIYGSTIVRNDDGVVIPNSPFHSEFFDDKDLEAAGIREREQRTSHDLLQVNGDFYLQLDTNNYAQLLLLDTVMDLQAGHTASANSESSRSTDSPFSCETQVKKEDHLLRLDGPSVPDVVQVDREPSPISMNGDFMTDTWPTEISKTIISEEFKGCSKDTQRINATEIRRRCRQKMELRRPWPRDRQLIQDRMKELRELIPDASKCSIDALLDKTIAHMLFLEGVSEKADKIQNALAGEPRHEGMKKQLEGCPLRVEELKQPGHLLIEILCEDHQVFLEMSHVLKGLELSILKGLLEHQSDRLWARFVVEASQGFNQMQMLCPLMHLLHRSCHQN